MNWIESMRRCWPLLWAPVYGRVFLFCKGGWLLTQRERKQVLKTTVTEGAASQNTLYGGGIYLSGSPLSPASALRDTVLSPCCCLLLTWTTRGFLRSLFQRPFTSGSVFLGQEALLITVINRVILSWVLCVIKYSARGKIFNQCLSLRFLQSTHWVTE